MKIIQKTEHLLKLKKGINRIPVLFAVVWGTGFSGIPLLLILMVMFSSGVQRLSCKKNEPKIATCEISTSNFMGLVKGELNSLEQVQEARVDKIDTTDSDGEPTVEYKVFLVTSQGDVYLVDQTVKDAELFNKYIQTSTGELVIEKDNRLLSLGIIIFASLFVVIGFGVMFGVLCCLICETYIFDKDASTLTLKKRGILVNEVAERSLGEISEVELEESEDNGDKFYEVRLLMNGGDRLCLGGSSNQKEQEKIVDWIRSYLKARSN